MGYEAGKSSFPTGWGHCFSLGGAGFALEKWLLCYNVKAQHQEPSSHSPLLSSKPPTPDSPGMTTYVMASLPPSQR